LVAVELKDAVIGGEFGSSRDPGVLDRRFRNIQNIVSQSHGYVASFNWKNMLAQCGHIVRASS